MIADYEPKERMPLVLKGYSIKDHHYDHYDNYDAINVDKCTDIPIDYDGVIGVPITILKYLWDDGFIHCVYTKKFNSYSLYCTQFEIVKFRKGDDDKDLSVNGYTPYFRILIRKCV